MDRVHTVDVLLQIAGTNDCPKAEITLRKLPALSLKNRQIADLLPIETFINLRALDLSGNPKVRDLSSLRFLYRLESLDVSDTGVSDTSPLREITTLKTLRFARDPLKTVAPLFTLRLRELDLTATRAADWRELPDSLETFRVSGVHGDHTHLPRLAKLRVLDLADTGIQDLAPLARLPDLRELILDRNSVSDVRPLRGLSNLDFLSLHETLVLDLSPLDRFRTMISF